MGRSEKFVSLVVVRRQQCVSLGVLPSRANKVDAGKQTSTRVVK